jgi:Resolvase, N terminal domain
MFLKRRGKFDMVMAWSVDRLGRSLQDLVHFLSELHALHVDLFLHQEGLDTTTPSVMAGDNRSVPSVTARRLPMLQKVDEVTRA